MTLSQGGNDILQLRLDNVTRLGEHYVHFIQNRYLKLKTWEISHMKTDIEVHVEHL